MIKPNHDLSLNQKLASIGFRINYDSLGLKLKNLSLLENADLEETLIHAAFEAKTDFRTLSILLSWITVHADYVIVEKFLKKIKLFEKIHGVNRVLDLMAAHAVINGSHKWKKAIRTHVKRPEFPVDPELLKTSIEFQGADDTLKKFGILIPKKLLRIRTSDVLQPAELSTINPQYRNRLLFGASWRSDIITAIEAGIKNPNQISKMLGCSYEPAYRIFKDYRAAHGI
ncbi:hypothetical protein WDW37_14375 [Bdellovibrionota bacterium FG-1]